MWKNNPLTALNVADTLGKEMTTMASPLEQEFKYFLDNQDELVKKHGGRFVVIKDRSVIGVYDDEVEAIKATSQKHEMGTFLVQRCEPGAEGYTQTFHSRVAFA
jgi:hypothetical protein